MGEPMPSNGSDSMRSKVLILLSLFFFWSHSVLAKDVIGQFVPNASVVGRGVLTYAFWDIYQATLYAPNGFWNPKKPFALSIEYYKELDGKDIADTTEQEMRKQGFTDEIKLYNWHARMKNIFPDVKNGTVLTAVYVPRKHTLFYLENKLIGSIKGDEFGRLFFGIWLSDNTSEPELRRALLGL